MAKGTGLSLLTLFLAFFGAFSNPAIAAQGRVGLLEDAAVDFALRLRLIQNARQSVDLIMSQHTSDTEIGLPLLLALRDAAERGIKVRMVSGYFPSVFSGSTRTLHAILDDSSLKVKPELILDGEWLHSPIRNPDASMWTSFDEKILIADGEKAVLGGRNVGADYLHWQDNSIYLDGAVVSELQTAFFEPTWALARQLYIPGSRAGSSRKFGQLRIPETLAAGLLQAAAIESSPQYTPESIELLPNGLIGKMMASAGRQLPTPTRDAILETFLKLAEHSKRAYFYSLFPAADKRMAEGLGLAVRNGSRIALITNSYESSRVLSKPPLPYDGGIVSMQAMADAGVTVYQWVPTPQLGFMHQKLAIVDDTVIFGSHNFNYSSTHNYDQLDVVIHDKALADLLAGRFEQQAAEHCRVADTGFLRWQKHHLFLGVQISKLLLGLY